MHIEPKQLYGDWHEHCRLLFSSAPEALLAELKDADAFVRRWEKPGSSPERVTGIHPTFPTFAPILLVTVGPLPNVYLATKPRHWPWHAGPGTLLTLPRLAA